MPSSVVLGNEADLSIQEHRSFRLHCAEQRSPYLTDQGAQSCQSMSHRDEADFSFAQNAALADYLALHDDIYSDDESDSTLSNDHSTTEDDHEATMSSTANTNNNAGANTGPVVAFLLPAPPMSDMQAAITAGQAHHYGLALKRANANPSNNPTTANVGVRGVPASCPRQGRWRVNKKNKTEKTVDALQWFEAYQLVPAPLRAVFNQAGAGIGNPVSLPLSSFFIIVLLTQMCRSLRRPRPIGLAGAWVVRTRST